MVHATISMPETEPDRTLALGELRLACSKARTTQFAEISVDRNDFPTLYALINGDRGWLMLLRYEGDAGFSSRSSDDPSSDEMLDFQLGNGQVDKYPRKWTLPTDEVLSALQQFALTGLVPETIAWFNDSGDGTSGPNDRSFSISEP